MLMIFLLLFALSGVFLFCKSFLEKKEVENIFMSKEQSNLLKGIAGVMIVLAHIVQYSGSYVENLFGGGSTCRVSSLAGEQ